MRFARAALTLVLALGACGGTSKPPSAAPNATFLIANPAGLVALDADGKVLGPLAGLPKDSAPASPFLFPDGKSLVFSLTLPPKGPTGFGSDIYVVNVDGTGLKSILDHEGENVFYASPQVEPKGSAIYVHRRAAIVKNGTYLGNEDTIERMELDTKKRTKILEGGADPTLSPDGKTIAYVKVVDAQPQGLWRVSTDGTGARPFFSTKDSWWYLQAPRFSPDGKSIVFSGAGHNAQTREAGRGLAHLGIPSDLFIGPVDGSSVKPVTQTSDDVVPAWSPDASQIAFIGLGALNILDVRDGTLRQLNRGNDFFFGDIVWVKR